MLNRRELIAYAPSTTLLGASAPRPDGMTIHLATFMSPNDGSDITQALQRARKFSAAAAEPNIEPHSDGNLLGRVIIEVPAGSWTVSEPFAMLNAGDFSKRTVGFGYVGAGAGLTQIIYNAVESGPLLADLDKVLHLRVSGIEFVSTNAQNSFLLSYSSGGAQDFGFTDVKWKGRWKTVISLTGTNNNSEHFYNQCRLAGEWDSFIGIDESGSDQFLNYWFSQTSYNSSSCMIRAQRGGHFHFTQCDFSGYSPSEPTHLFELGGTSHAEGVAVFSVSDSRFELKSASAGVLKSEWTSGAISFVRCDFSSQAFRPELKESVFFSIGSGSTFPIVSFDECLLMGRFDIRASGAPSIDSFNFTRSGFKSFSSFEDAFIYSGTRKPVITLSNCQLYTGRKYDPSPVINWNIDSAVPTLLKTLCLYASKHIGMPFYLPSEAILLSIRTVWREREASRLPADRQRQRWDVLDSGGRSIATIEQEPGFELRPDYLNPEFFSRVEVGSISLAGPVDDRLTVVIAYIG